MENFKQNLLLYWQTQKTQAIVIIVIFATVTLMTFILFVVSLGKGKQNTASDIIAQDENQKTSNVQETSLNNPPKVSFESYKNTTSIPQLPSMIRSYTFKTDFSKEEIAEFGDKLGLNSIQETDTEFLISNTQEPGKIGILTFNKKTGGFNFISYGKLSPENQEEKDPKLIAYQFLQFLSKKIADDSLICNITYNKQGQDQTYVECHRDWQKAGLPILNFIGLLNVPEETALDSLKLGSIDNNTPEDPLISNVSTGKSAEGKMRPNDFNTITVAVTKEGNITSIDSNLRWIEKVSSIENTQLLQPKEALKMFGQGKSQLKLTLPAGTGDVDFDKVYQNNEAKAKEALITDYVLSYLENPPTIPQKELVPMYTIRGYATLENGYRVKYIETIPAIRP